MYKLLYPSIRVRTAPPVSVRARDRLGYVSVSFSYGVVEFWTAVSRLVTKKPISVNLKILSVEYGYS